MRTYGQHCPILRGAEIFATRWTPVIVRNMLLGARTFTEIRAGAPGLPKSVLVDRLKQLEHYGVLERRPNPGGRGHVYELTPAGRGLQDVCDALGTWGARWLEASDDIYDSGVVMWSLYRLLDRARLPEERVVVRFVFREAPGKRFWLLLQHGDAELCMKPTGYPDDLVVTTEAEWLAKWQLGRIELGEAMHRGLIEIAGPPRLVRAFARWGGRSDFAGVQPAFSA